MQETEENKDSVLRAGLCQSEPGNPGAAPVCELAVH